MYIFLRFFAVTLLLLPWAIRHFPRRISVKSWLVLLFVAVLEGPVNYILVINGLALTNLSSAAFILLAEPVIVFMLASWLLREKVDSRMKFGLSLALIGAGIITLGSAGFRVAGVSLLGNMFIFGVIVFSATSLIITKQLTKEINPRFLLWLMAFMTAIVSLWFVDIDVVASELSRASGLALGGLAWGIFASTIIAYYCYFFAVRALRAGEVGVFRYVDPLAGIFVGFIFLGEAFSSIYIIGGVIVAYGIFIVETKKKRLAKRTLSLSYHQHKHHRLFHRS